MGLGMGKKLPELLLVVLWKKNFVNSEFGIACYRTNWKLINKWKILKMEINFGKNKKSKLGVISSTAYSFKSLVSSLKGFSLQFF